jgi:hypothetical protein
MYNFKRKHKLKLREKVNDEISEMSKRESNLYNSQKYFTVYPKKKFKNFLTIIKVFHLKV